MDLLELRRLHALAADKAREAAQHRDNYNLAEDASNQDMYNVLYEGSLSEYYELCEKIESIHASNLILCSGGNG